VRQRAAFFAWLAERLAVRLAERLVDADPAAIKHADDPARAQPAPLRKPRLRLTAAVTEDRSG